VTSRRPNKASLFAFGNDNSQPRISTRLFRTNYSDAEWNVRVGPDGKIKPGVNPKDPRHRNSFNKDTVQGKPWCLICKKAGHEMTSCQTPPRRGGGAKAKAKDRVANEMGGEDKVEEISSAARENAHARTCTHARTRTHACTHHVGRQASRQAGRQGGRQAGKLASWGGGGAGRKAGMQKKLWGATRLERVRFIFCTITFAYMRPAWRLSRRDLEKVRSPSKVS
jgi:hypothetical protein